MASPAIPDELRHEAVSDSGRDAFLAYGHSAVRLHMRRARQVPPA